MSDNRTATVEIVEEHGSFLLIRAASRFAVVERRAGRIYPMKSGGRDGVPMTPEAIAALLMREGTMTEDEARQLFAELSDRGNRLAQSLR